MKIDGKKLIPLFETYDGKHMIMTPQKNLRFMKRLCKKEGCDFLQRRWCSKSAKHCPVPLFCSYIAANCLTDIVYIEKERVWIKQ